MGAKIQVGDFFSLQNSVENIKETDYAGIDVLIEAAKAFERSTYQCVYIIDYFKRGFLYVSNNVARLCGCEPTKIKDFGYRFYIDYVPEEDLKMLLEINTSGFELFNRLPVQDWKNYTISYDFHICKDGKRKGWLVNHKLTPLVLSSDGKIWLSICTISLAAGNTAGNVIMKKYGADTYYEYSLDNHEWIVKDEIVLSESERKVLSLSTQGYIMSDIAEKLCKSIDTIKTINGTSSKRWGYGI